jgi:hypothetical protein
MLFESIALLIASLISKGVARPKTAAKKATELTKMIFHNLELINNLYKCHTILSFRRYDLEEHE